MLLAPPSLRATVDARAQRGREVPTGQRKIIEEFGKIACKCDDYRCVRSFRFAGRFRRVERNLRPDGKTISTQSDGSQLPKPDPAFKGKIGETYKDSTPELSRSR